MKEQSIQIPGGLADPDGEFAYIMGPQGLIYRLDLKSGEVQASTSHPGSPLVISDDKLISWSRVPDYPNIVRLSALVPQGGILNPVWEQSIELPTWVEVGSPEPGRFNLQAEIQEEQLVITWEAHSRYSSGAPPPPGVEAAETRDASGTLNIDPLSGRILSEAGVDSLPGTAQALPELQADWHIVPYLQGETWATHPWSVDSGDVFLVRVDGVPGILLVRRDSESTASPEMIRLTDDPAAVATVTTDGQYVFVHEPGSESPSWLVYSVETGEMIAKLPFDSGTQGVSIVNDQVLYLLIQELGTTRLKTLQSRNLHSGELMWSFTLDEEIAMTPPPPPP